MSNRLIRLAVVTRILPVACVLISTFPILAQNRPGDAEIKLPAPGAAPEPKFWVSYLVSAAMLAAIIMVSLRPAKRSHQD